MPKIIVITGTPGTGKTTIAERLKRKINGAVLIRATDLVNKKRFYSKVDKDGVKVADIQKLRKEIVGKIKKSDSPIIIIEGHLVCEFKIKGAKVIVLRAHLNTLLKRLRRRGYSLEKIRDNLVSEATDYCGITAAENYGDVYEFLSDDRRTMKYIIALAKGAKQKKQNINLMQELQTLLKRDREYVLYSNPEK